MDDLRGRKVLVLGLGVNQGGVGVARYLVERGAEVRVSDMQPRDRLALALAQLESLPIRYTLGRHEAKDMQWADIVVRNPGVPRESPWLELARQAGARIEMEMTLFFRACPAPIIGVTGTKGKTTTATLLATLLRQRWPEARLAGNMGRSAVMELGSLRPDVPVVIELSSFQLEGLDEQGLSPHIAVLTNIAEDHLDRYASMDEYAGVKAAIARYQVDTDWLVYNRDDTRLADLLAGAPGRAVTFGRDDTGDARALWIESEWIRGRWDGREHSFGSIRRLRLPGEHAWFNLMAAIAAATAVGIGPAEIEAGIGQAEPVADRLEPVATVGGVEYINDTTATVPVAAVAALRAYAGRRLIVVAGGSEKHVSLDDFVLELVARASAVVLLAGAATRTLQRLLDEQGYRGVHGPFDDMEHAVEQAASLAQPGDVVLLSPGCASFGMFQNEFDRGRQFREAVARLAAHEEVVSR
jgi:UDP-N-acetylmuramoylalanine--D-glutamate ligase